MASGSAGRLAESLDGLDAQGLRRSRRVLDSPHGAHVMLDGREAINFSGNDYLGLANDARMRAAAHAAIDAYGVGAGASPLVSGHLRVHEEAERRFAAFVGLPRALLFPSGYAANLGIVATLCDRHAEVFLDRLDHACLYDGALLSRASVTRYAHGDLAALERALAASRAPERLVATDTVFSMDGDVAPLRELLASCERHGAWLLLDDAHGIGVLGPQGRGALAHFGLASPRIVYMATLGKALGGYGAFVAGDATMVETLLQRARTLIFSTALPPLAPAAAVAAIDILEADAGLVGQLHDRITRFRHRCAEAGIPIAASATSIQPLRVASPEAAVESARRLLERGYLVAAIRPPTVPAGTSRLRISLSAAHEDAHIDGLVEALSELPR